MLTIPIGLDHWYPADVAAWRADLDDDPTLTVSDYARADRAVSVALLGESAAAEIHGAATHARNDK